MATEFHTNERARAGAAMSAYAIPDTWWRTMETQRSKLAKLLRSREMGLGKRLATGEIRLQLLRLESGAAIRVVEGWYLSSRLRRV